MFTEREWLVMFPREPAPFAGPSLVDRPADPAKALRESDPLTRRNFLAALAPWPLVRNLVRVQLALTPYVSRVALRFGPSALFTGTVLAGTVVLNAGTFRAFHTAQLAVGIASVSLFFLTTLVIALYSRGFQSLITLPTFRGTRGTSGTSGSASAEYGWHPFATMARYQQLLSDGSKGPVDSDPEAKESSLINESGASLLFQHDSDDSHCPCSDCTRALTDRAGPFQLLEISLRVLTLDVLVMFAVWTPFVSFGAEYWRIWWCALFGAFFVLNVLDLNTLNALVRFTDNVAVILLKQRVRRRAVVLALRDFYRRLRASLDGEESELADPASEPHVVLHAFLADAWQRGFVTFSSGGLSTIVIYCVAPTVGAMANLVGGSRTPALRFRPRSRSQATASRFGFHSPGSDTSSSSPSTSSTTPWPTTSSTSSAACTSTPAHPSVSRYRGPRATSVPSWRTTTASWPRWSATSATGRGSSGSRWTLRLRGRSR
ncbi:hypothetical protein DFJ74DRAFT_320298 [Hyaloraphidium curvatum]|nr:hypothetical protein DFJ74DRAFT_320298 [Hyaloraphidium curvatum]